MLNPSLVKDKQTHIPAVAAKSRRHRIITHPKAIPAGPHVFARGVGVFFLIHLKAIQKLSGGRAGAGWEVCVWGGLSKPLSENGERESRSRQRDTGVIGLGRLVKQRRHYRIPRAGLTRTPANYPQNANKQRPYSVRKITSRRSTFTSHLNKRCDR